VSSIVTKDLFPTPDDEPGPAPAEPDEPDEVEPGQHPGGGWISGTSTTPHSGPHMGGADQ
jgi:hypothetical protein